MDSEDECKNVDSDEETDGDDLYYSDHDVASEYDVEYDDKSDDEGCQKHTVLEEEHLRNQQQEDITKVSTTLSIPRVSAALLLRRYNWDVMNAQDACFDNEEEVRKDVGLLEEQVEVPIENMEKTVIKCGICFDEFARCDMCAANCGHLFCKLCWTRYVSIKIKDGPGCLMMRCPDPSCAAAVGQDMVDRLVSEEDKMKYSRFLYRSYVEDKRKNAKWCPGPDCEFLIEFVAAAGSSNYDVVCNCGHNFCWNCVEDAHRPVDCDTVRKWAVKNTAESANVTWILANSKSCPKCKKPIQKNKGCMHMTCSCRFEFCWLCLGAWSTHGSSTGGFFACNVYAKAKAEGRYDEGEKIKKKAKDYLDKYTHYFERFAENQKSRLKAVESLQKMKAEYIGKLSELYATPETQFGYITDAWLQIIECRRVLKWTYAYGYYLPDSEHAKKQLFEFFQGQAESGLERLHQCAEVELQSYLIKKDDDKPKELDSFRMNILDQTKITGNYFENLVRALQSGLSDVTAK